MAWYNTGTIALTNGSATVTGSGTNFLVGAQIGEALYAPDGKLYEIQTINSATVITLASNYLGSTASGQNYQIIPTQSLVADLASDVTDLISDFANVRDYAGNGKFNDGAVGTPGITFTQDQDNGLYRIGSNNWALASGGIKQVDLSATDVEINYAGVKKLATSASGIDVTGTVTADGLTVDSTTGFLWLPVSTAGAKVGAIGTGTGLIINTPSVNADFGSGLAIDGSYASSLSSVNIKAFGAKFGSYGSELNLFTSDDTSLLKRQTIASNGDISFYEDTGTTPKFVWSASAESLGIGTTPIAPLHVKGTTNGNLLVRAGSLAVGTLTGTALSSINDAASATVPLTFEGSEFNFVQSNAVKVKVDSSGNVGIGVVPDTWSLASHGVIDLGLYGSVNSSSTLGTTLSFNAYYNSGWKAKNTTGAMLYLQDSASHQWFTSSSVNADATITDFSGPKMKLDASGNLLVGKTATAFGTAGVEASASSGLWSTRSGFPALALNRLSTEGSVADFYKDGTIVGSIGSKQNDTGTGNSYIYIAGGNTGLFFDDVNNYIRPANTSGGLRDNIVDLGEPDSRFKDLFIGNDIGHLDAADNARLLYDKSANLLGNAGTNGTFATLSKSSGSFKIDHPLPEKTETHYLVHSFVESPQANNIYRGKVDLVDGLAAVNIDDAAGMTEGTYVLLNTNTQCFTSNESGWTAVKGSVSGNILTITAQDNTCTDTISWMVIGERHDQHMLDTEWTDENGKVIVEPLKESQGDAP